MQSFAFSWRPWIVLQVGVLGWCVGKYLEPTGLKWIVLGWSVVLIDIIAFEAMMSGSGRQTGIGYALASSQIRMLIVWTFLGPPPWTWRMPAAVVALAALLLFASSVMVGWRSEGWSNVLVFNAIVLTGPCIWLRISGFELQREHARSTDDTENAETRVFQFTPRHLLVWTAALPPVLLVARGLDLWVLARLKYVDLFPTVVLGTLLVVTSLVALWAVLGTGTLWFRLVTLITLPGVLGLGLQLLAASYAASRRPPWRAPSVTYHIITMQSQWISWLYLATGLLAAMLLFLRACDYRLVKTVATER